MLELKKYQERAISEFEEYLIQSRQFGAEKGHKIAFLANNPGQNKYNDHGIEHTPFVCIKMPTGGGKTVVACHTLHSIYAQFLKSKNERGLVMWLVPTDIIRTQTLSALRDRKHPYREVLDYRFANNLQIFSFKEALSIKKSDLEDNLCIVVATFGAFRITDKEGRKAYDDNGKLLEHFQNISENNLDKATNGEIKYSLFNVVKLSRPIIIIDESHHTKTKLSIDMIKNMNPSFVLEYTATPRPESNVIVNVTASELKEADMVKIPIYLTNIAQWQQTIREGISKRNELEKVAKKEKGEYIRPIVLIQAQQEKEDVKRIYVKEIHDFLVSEGIRESEIAIKTGKQDQLSTMDLFSKDCQVRYIITVSALKEGWDNSFAYVLISVANIGARIPVEQTIGRIIRLPRATRKRHEELNVSYVYTSSRNFAHAAKELEMGLLANGYSRKDLKQLTEKGVVRSNIYKKKYADNDIKIPFLAVEDIPPRKLEFFEDLVGKHFDISKQAIADNFEMYYDQDRTQKIDVSEGDKLTRSVQTKLDIIYDFRDFTKDDLLNWLDRRVLRKEYSQEEKRKFFSRIIETLLGSKKYDLSDLSINCYKLKDVIESQIDAMETTIAKKTFTELEDTDRISVDTIFQEFAEEIEIDNTSDDTFERHLYEKAGRLNSEELALALKIDQMDHIAWWYRNVEKEGFYLQGWKRGKFYPDFILKTKSGKYALVEYKGENLLETGDTLYKNELGRKWEGLAGENYRFYLVSKETMDEWLKEIQRL